MPRIARTVAAGIGLVGSVVASQGPEFAQQYRQRLGGAIDELRRVVQRFDADASANRYTREEALGRLGGNTEDLVSRQGVAMRANVERLERLERHRQAYVEAGPFQRLFIFVRDFDLDLMEAAYQDFEPAVPATQEGFVAAGLGFVAGWGVTRAIAALFRRMMMFGRRRAHNRRLAATASLSPPR
jgi:hypothetical protein